MSLKYTGLGGEILLDSPPYLCIDHDFNNYVWNSMKTGNFNKKPKRYKLKIKIVDAKNFHERLNYMSDIFESDIANNAYGKLCVNDYYLNCAVSASNKSNWYLINGIADVELDVYAQHPVWIKEKKFLFRNKPAESIVTDKRNFDYNYDFNYDFSSDYKNRAMLNESFKGVKFELVIFGPCENPVLNVGGNIYKINESLEKQERIIIDSRNKTILKVNKFNESSNIFHKRSKETYVFEDIKSGLNKVTWDGSFGFDITLFEERSEPKWI